MRREARENCTDRRHRAPVQSHPKNPNHRETRSRTIMIVNTEWGSYSTGAIVSDASRSPHINQREGVQMREKLKLAALAVGALALIASPSWASLPNKCQGAKIKDAGKKAA